MFFLPLSKTTLLDGDLDERNPFIFLRSNTCYSDASSSNTKIEQNWNARLGFLLKDKEFQILAITMLIIIELRAHKYVMIRSVTSRNHDLGEGRRSQIEKKSRLTESREGEGNSLHIYYIKRRGWRRGRKEGGEIKIKKPSGARREKRAHEPNDAFREARKPHVGTCDRYFSMTTEIRCRFVNRLQDGPVFQLFIIYTYIYSSKKKRDKILVCLFGCENWWVNVRKEFACRLAV